MVQFLSHHRINRKEYAMGEYIILFLGAVFIVFLMYYFDGIQKKGIIPTIILMFILLIIGNYIRTLI